MADTSRASWWARYPVEEGAGRPATREWVAVQGPQFPPASVVDHPRGRRPAGWLIAVRASATDDRVHRVEVALPDVPLLWYVELDEPDATPAARTLVAFSDSRYAEGTVLIAAEARAAGVDGGRQVAAVRWWPDTGLGHQIYVAPAARRRGLALKLATAAAGLQVVRGLPPMHGDGRRTNDGEAWLGRLPDWAAERFAGRTDVMPSMTPA
ncbi:hypothetical protein [Blastococcus sp. URHD0036]|uniref:hypothetical protein n=1 Tax=Blastococcus sp. URHD0036 TaxID=1380356 RepID=UPI0004952674|nr:hypothetical protein [Blastococcus sp. URHD0036]